ncbi:MAG: thermonuclease family protein [Gammaproteobacteria bacterium]|nr:thermonuclease family protein [Gammaproteobacteria bacterium]
MDWLQITLLGLLQGLTEFLPISSSAHLILVPELIGWEDQGLAFDVAVHLGTLSAVISYFWRDITHLLQDWWQSIMQRQTVGESRLAWGVLLATLPVGIAGLLFKDIVETTLRSPQVLAWATLMFGLLLWYWLGCLGVMLVVLPACGAGFYRWQDGEGNYHYGDNPPPQGSYTPLEINSQDGWYRVKEVYDGDTLTLQSGERVRLIGLNAPEVARQSRPDDPLSGEAKLFLQQLVEGKRVRLQPGVERYDKYQRLLAHLFDESGENINAMILREGLAHAMIKPPNSAYSDIYFAAEAAARQAVKGIWALDGYQITPIGEAANYRNTFRRLQGRVVRVEEKKSLWLLYFANEVKVSIAKEYVPQFIAAKIDLPRLAGRTLMLRGWVQQHQGKPIIRLVDPLEIEHIYPKSLEMMEGGKVANPHELRQPK